jgi:hypothetical protein
MLYHGPVRVPDNARAGKAILRVDLMEGSDFRSLPTDLEVTLVRK